MPPQENTGICNSVRPNRLYSISRLWIVYQHIVVLSWVQYIAVLNCQEASGVKVSDRGSGVFLYLTNVKFAL
ncbi:hypothetical protein [Nostoc sp. TCL240-02]|uniref:hypothetical protein n=1 Tax=Nostoc sp. TCL240-02 TaxID=2572090 RepID=UPI00157F96D3|nr:hypothetical protein [Nostoc sp. TCL240-02]